MLFQHTLDLVLSGRKTKTSRLVSPDHAAEVDANGGITTVLVNGREKYRVGKTYAVQPARGKPAVARIRLTGIERKQVSEISAEEAAAEGYASREAFFEAWHHIHGEHKHQADVWVLSFELV